MEQVKTENTEELLRHSENACYACNWNSRRKEREVGTEAIFGGIIANNFHNH